MRLAVLIPLREVGHFGREERHGSKYKQNENGQGKKKKKKKIGSPMLVASLTA